MINRIGIKNFRVFKDFTNFEIKPITLLIGPNSSGKSSFTKLLLLLQNGIKKLDFEKGKHNLESFNKVLTWDSNNDKITLQLNSNLDILSDEFSFELTYNKDCIEKICLLNSQNNKLLASIDYSEEIIKDDEDFKIVTNRQKVAFDINYFIDLIYKKEIYVKEMDRNNKKEGFSTKIKIALKYMDRSIDKTKTVTLNKLKTTYNKFFKPKTFYLDSIRNIAIYNEIDTLPRNYLLYNIYKEKENITKKYEAKILEIQTSTFNNLAFYLNGEMEGTDAHIDMASKIFLKLGEKAKKQITTEINNLFGTEDVRVQETRLGKLLFTEKTFDDEIENSLYYQKSLFDMLSKVHFLEFSSGFKYIQYISANRGSQKRVLMNQSDVDIDHIVTEFSKIKNPNLNFLKESLHILGLEGELEVVRYENYISVIYLINNGKKTALADIGFGYSQVIPILLKIAIMMGETKPKKNIVDRINSLNTKILIIEEPEANLHPKLQSKLADILLLSTKYLSNIKFIIETHSEYLVRKLQYLTAKKEIKTSDVIIHYFNDEEYVSRTEPKVKQIQILKNGNLSDTFGPGFYDEVTNLQFNLLKINKEQNN